MTEKYIKASECEKYFYEHLDDIHIAGAMNAIDEMPNADVAPICHGHWIECNYGLTFECSECKYPTEYNLTDYCPSCGAKMDGDKNA